MRLVRRMVTLGGEGRLNVVFEEIRWGLGSHMVRDSIDNQRTPTVLFHSLSPPKFVAFN